jgi:methyltransferase
MTSLTFFTALVVLVGVERLAELVVSTRNAAWSLQRGGTETGQGHYPVMVVLHTGLLVGMLVEAWVRRPVVPLGLAATMLVLAVASQVLRWWCITTLGPRWNTRVIVVPGLPLVSSGPYRYLSHPNYVAVVVEGVALPLVHAAWITALVFTVANAALLTVRLRVENAALAALAHTSRVARGDRQGVRRGPDAGGGQRPARPRGADRRPATRRDPLRGRHARGRGAVPLRSRSRGTAHRAAPRPAGLADGGRCAGRAGR